MRQLKDFYEEMRRCLKEAPLFVLYLDGLGYYMYEYAKREGRISAMEEKYRVEPAQSVFPPLTNPALATILTGRMPGEHKILNRSSHVLQVPTIFDEWKGNSAYLEGDSVIVRTNPLPKLHTAWKGQKGDERIFHSALKEIDKGTYFIFVHFHGIDDAAHMGGPYSLDVLAEIKRKDEIAGVIAEHFPGQVLLISDHGLHEEGKGGDHGNTCHEDLTVIWGTKL
ncbi:MAG: alkaline phosphatase family protein [Ruminococcus sp.]